jgi:hypothetical protein
MRAIGVAAAAVLCLTGSAYAQTDLDYQRQIQELRQRLDQLERERPVAPSGVAAADATVQRALERSLIEQGGLLLPAGTFDIVPELQYSHFGSNQLGIVGAAVTNVVFHQDTLETGLIARYGLPFDAQFNLHVPYIVSWTRTSAIGTTTSRTDTGIGDVDFGLSKQILYERGLIPDVLAQITYKVNTGSAVFSPTTALVGPTVTSSLGRIGGTGTGFNDIIGGLTAVRRQDPLVFLAGVSYDHTFDRTIDGTHFSPGDAIEGRLGSILAASPDTSLRTIFDVARVDKTKVSGLAIAGSDRVLAFLELGGSAVVSRSVLIDAAVQIGLTRDTPDFRFIFSVPIHF